MALFLLNRSFGDNLGVDVNEFQSSNKNLIRCCCFFFNRHAFPMLYFKKWRSQGQKNRERNRQHEENSLFSFENWKVIEQNVFFVWGEGRLPSLVLFSLLSHNVLFFVFSRQSFVPDVDFVASQVYNFHEWASWLRKLRNLTNFVIRIIFRQLQYW